MSVQPVGTVAATLAFAPLGIPLRVEVGRGIDPAAIEAACKAWRGPADEGARSIGLRIARSPALAGTGEPRIVVDGRKVEIAGQGAEGWGSVDTRLARCTVSDAYLADPHRLLEDVLEPLLLFMLAHFDRTPIHAAGFVADDLAILVSGPSGAGKSSLAFAADAAGWQVLSDDTVYVQRHPCLKLWGFPRAAHFSPEDCPVPHAHTRVRGGTVKHAVPFTDQRGMASAGNAILCLLAHGSKVALTPLDAPEAIRKLPPLEPGFDLFMSESEAVYKLLTSRGAWLLTLSRDPAEAVALLADNLVRLRCTAGSPL